jgi:hypothetical protein
MSDDNETSNDAVTPLDLTLDRIGMGYYQWSLLGLCGFGVLHLFIRRCSCSNQQILLLPRLAR